MKQVLDIDPPVVREMELWECAVLLRLDTAEGAALRNAPTGPPTPLRPDPGLLPVAKPGEGPPIKFGVVKLDV